tara:strand:- start:174 stop:1229 length:1056 start_codon:yes stop_codon:yes gene_type:complete
MNVAIIGATGYGGIQLVNILRKSKDHKITFLGGNKSSGSKWNDLFPFIKVDDDPLIEKISTKLIAERSDVAMLSLPSGLSSTITPELITNGIKVIDLSADYRYKSLDKWKEIYFKEAALFNREDYDLCSESVYGIPEIYQNEIKNSRLIACPGCYPTCSLIPLIPFLSQGIIENDGIIIDSKSGISGGGRTPKEHLLFSEASEGISAYGLLTHRHTSEIEQILSYASGLNTQLIFTPHLIPIVRGMFSTIYGRLKDPGLTADDCKILLDNFYRNSTNVKILPVGTYPSSKWAKNSNDIYLSVNVDNRSGKIILLSTIDNLLKGQAGQAVQNLNLISGLNSNEGLDLATFYP